MKNPSFAASFQELSHYLKSVAYILTKDKYLAEDLYQETAFRAFKYKDKFSEDTNFKAWLITIMRNTFINDFRKRKRKKTLQDTTPENYLINSSDKSVSNNGESTVLIKELHSLIEDLDEDLKAPFLMSYKGFKYREISHHMKLPIGTVKSRIFIARKELKYKIKKLYNANSTLELAA